ncbi:hypothetical protein V2J09_011306 [Rumex salicifolius]
MALQWTILTYLVAAETALALLITLPMPKLLKSRLVSLVSLILQPCMFVLPFAGFQLLDIYWKMEHRLVCTSDICTAAERDRFEKSVMTIDIIKISTYLLAIPIIPIRKTNLPIPSQFYKAQRNVVLCVAACLLYWCIFRICKYNKEIQRLEEVEKRYKQL